MERGSTSDLLRELQAIRSRASQWRRSTPKGSTASGASLGGATAAGQESSTEFPAPPRQENLPSCAISTLVDIDVGVEKSAIEENHGCYSHRSGKAIKCHLM